jgi:hypothetical protein
LDGFLQRSNFIARNGAGADTKNRANIGAGILPKMWHLYYHARKFRRGADVPSNADLPKPSNGPPFCGIYICRA